MEKRLDNELLYLRDAPLHYSAVPFDLEATPHPKGAAVPVNPLQVECAAASGCVIDSS